MILGFCKCPKQGYNDDETLLSFIKRKHATKGEKKEQEERTEVLEYKRNPKKQSRPLRGRGTNNVTNFPPFTINIKRLCLKNLTKIHIIVGVF
jgi:hypothetical protein